MSEHGVHLCVAPFSVCALMAGVVEFNAHHGHPVGNSAYQEIHVLLADFVEASSVVMLDEVSQPWLARNEASALR
ncbi:MAG: hypothetical protein ABL962_10775 [Fimbriimonadaceae bacterium]